MGSSWTRDWTRVPCIGRQILNHCATREVPICRLFDDGHSDQCELIPPCTFDLHFSKNQQCWAFFSCACWPSVCLWWNIYLGLLPIFWLGCLGVFFILSCMNYLYILEIKPLLVTSFANIFSKSTGCLFILLLVSFAVPKLISLVRYHFLIFAFISFVLGDLTKKTLLQFMSENVLPMFSSRSFMVSCLIF